MDMGIMYCSPPPHNSGDLISAAPSAAVPSAAAASSSCHRAKRCLRPKRCHRAHRHPGHGPVGFAHILAHGSRRADADPRRQLRRHSVGLWHSSASRSQKITPPFESILSILSSKLSLYCVCAMDHPDKGAVPIPNCRMPARICSRH